MGIRKRLSGSSTRPRLSVYRSNKGIYAQIIDDVSGKTLVSASSLSKDFTAPEGSKIDQSVAVGKLVAEKALAAGMNKRRLYFFILLCTCFVRFRIARMALFVSTLLHSIAVGNLLPASCKVICVDINPASVTKLADRGSMQTIGLVMDAASFLRELWRALEQPA